jgi:hypothetical protein
MKIKIALIALLLLITSQASATILATLDNKAGGKIVLTNTQVDTCKNGYAAYSTSPTSNTSWGCWFVDEEFVHITWLDDGNTHSYEINEFTVREDPPKF